MFIKNAFLQKAILLIGILLLLAKIATGAEGKRVLFLVQTNRERSQLESYGVFMANIIQTAKPGSYIQAMTTKGKTIFSLQLLEQQNVLQLKRAKNRAVNDVRRFFLNLFDKGKKEDKVDIAAGIRMAIERFNSEVERKQRYVLVLLTHGLQKDDAVNLQMSYPSDSWIIHPESPFSVIPSNKTGRKLDVIFITEDDYLSSFQRKRIKRWYALLFHHKNAQLIGFTSDHETAAHLIQRGGSPLPVPKAEDIYAPLCLYRVDSDMVQYAQKLKDSTSLRYRAKPKILTGQVFKMNFEQGVNTLWLSVRDASGEPLKNLKRRNFQVTEKTEGKSRKVPISEITLNSRDTGFPLATVLLRDVSTSLDDKAVSDSADAIETYIDSMLPKDNATLIAFSDKVITLQPWTSNPTALKAALHRPFNRGGTVLFDALFKSALSFEEAKRGLKAIITFTDGRDTGSKSNLQEASTTIRTAGVPVFLIGVGDTNKAILNQIASQTNGLYFCIKKTEQLKKIYSTIHRILSSTYLLSYPTKAHSGNSVEVEVKVQSKSGKGEFSFGRLK